MIAKNFTTLHGWKSFAQNVSISNTFASEREKS
jgi:hypothetical protein